MSLQVQLRHFVDCSKSGKDAASGEFQKTPGCGRLIQADSNEYFMNTLHEVLNAQL
jgi:hypothetical protein